MFVLVSLWLSGKPQVAFSVALGESAGDGRTGPFNTDTTIQYKKIFTNTGRNYNPSTGSECLGDTEKGQKRQMRTRDIHTILLVSVGVFTATVKGMYFFRFSMFNSKNSVSNSGVGLFKNSIMLATAKGKSGDDSSSGSNAAVVPLEVGDTVYVQLEATRFDKHLLDSFMMNFNTFSGFLLFTT